MFKNRRATERHAARGGAKMQWAGTLPRDCVITDISDGGVRLLAEGIDVPTQFVLVFGDGRTRRECRVVWRLGAEVGAEFADSGQVGFGRRMAGSRVA